MPEVLTTATLAMCPHGGMIKFNESVPTVMAGGAPVIPLGEISTVIGCPFVVGTAPMPCVTVQWTMPAAEVAAGGRPVLTKSSIGLCINAAQAPQGNAQIDLVQLPVQAR